MSRNMFDYINASSFFRDYCPDVKNLRHKMRGKNTRGNPMDFSDKDVKLIMEARERFAEALLTMDISRAGTTLIKNPPAQKKAAKRTNKKV